MGHYLGGLLGLQEGSTTCLGPNPVTRFQGDFILPPVSSLLFARHGPLLGAVCTLGRMNERNHQQVVMIPHARPALSIGAVVDQRRTCAAYFYM